MSDRYRLHHGDCFDVMQAMDANSIDAIVTDPPYGLKFMNRLWDYGVPGKEFWQEALRVAKPGCHMLAFGGVAYAQDQWTLSQANQPLELPITAPATDAARQWQGWGSALKPAYEPIVLARKPIKGTIANNVQTYGVGGINIDECRVKSSDVIPDMTGKSVLGGTGDGWSRPWKSDPDAVARGEQRAKEAIDKANTFGRWPANFIHDGSDEVVDLLGSAARFFYCAKASAADRDEGLQEFEEVRCGGMKATEDGSMLTGSGNPRITTRKNHHPTVKPTDLMRYLCRMITPPNGVVLDPFMGSGSTGKAAILEGFRFVGIELDQQYIQIANGRISAVMPATDLFSDVGGD